MSSKIPRVTGPGSKITSPMFNELVISELGLPCGYVASSRCE